MQGALHADLFTYREEHLHPRVPGTGCLDPAQAVQNGGHAGEVVGAARTVVPSETIFPSRTRGLMPKPFWTRSTWAASRTEPSVCPSSTAIRFPAVPSTLDAVSSSRTVQPRASSFPFSASTMARSLTGDRVDLRQLDEFFYNRYCHAASSLLVMVSQRCGTCAPSHNVLPWTPCGIATGVPIFGPSAETIANTGLFVPEHGLADVTGV